jgi:hypothetical protein
MVPSLCRGSTAIPAVSRFRAGRGGGPEPIQPVYLPLAGSIGTRIVAPLF